ncbi:methionyl-tRNA formyltransferase [Candidatus Dojkabacteria bacterium HGW-Dojkabacteria-1]|uniref:Methionyl-tRNA formyltransferase n=1 Tax=Candidatus Dojkabacteria bacterium HGW-Dojkabacteria-1 TaxID=2013761 RepID=A0A2N2F2Y9_9BACT|nr:MAG: methionyl-tRNA formyltransferase [Candidatus Dojkabacteria bacterium HGW-Dojkabacteria-1]
MVESIKTLFLGTDWESVETLKALHIDERFDIVGVITTTDKPVGRKQILTPSKVKDYALENGIEVFHTEKNEERYAQALELFKPELIVCKAFGEIVPGFFLEYPKYKAINVHFSILPKYRGAVPIQKAILDGENETGISIMLMSEGMDEGDVLEIYREPILPNDTNQSLRERLVKKSAEVLGDILEDWIEGNITPEKQDDSKATYCWQKDISKDKAEILWDEMDPKYIERLVRAMIPWPVAWFVIQEGKTRNLQGKIVKIYEAELVDIDSNLKPGSPYVSNDCLLISTKDRNTSLRIKDLQIEGRNRLKEKDFINGIGKDLIL